MELTWIASFIFFSFFADRIFLLFFFQNILLFVLIHCTALTFICTVLCSKYANLDKVYNEVRLEKRIHHRQGIHLSFVLFSWYCATFLERFSVEGFRIHYTGPTSSIKKKKNILNHCFIAYQSFYWNIL